MANYMSAVEGQHSDGREQDVPVPREDRKNPASSAWVAWTGGSKPLPLHEIPYRERKLVDALYEAQCAGFRAFWGKDPDAATCQTYLIHARYDAHATVRAGVENNIVFTG